MEMDFDFKNLSMMDLRSSPGEILDKVYDEGEAFIIERNNRQKACLVPIWYFLPDIPKDRVNNELDQLRLKGENPILNISKEKELEVTFKSEVTSEDSLTSEITIKIVMPHKYPINAPRVYVFPILNNAPHRWKDGSLCILGAMTNWNPGKHNLAFILTLARKWLGDYAEWVSKGKWPINKGKKYD